MLRVLVIYYFFSLVQLLSTAEVAHSDGHKRIAWNSPLFYTGFLFKQYLTLLPGIVRNINKLSN
jgi:hypothetical protein